MWHRSLARPSLGIDLIWFIVFAFAIIFTLIIFVDRVGAQSSTAIDSENLSIESSSTVIIKSDLEIFNELPDFQKYEITLVAKEASDNLASKYAKLYDTCRFTTGFISNQ